MRAISKILVVPMFLAFLGSGLVAEAAARSFTGAAVASDTLGCGLGSEAFDLKIAGDEFQVKMRNFAEERIVVGRLFQRHRKIRMKWEMYTDFGNVLADGHLDVHEFSEEVFHASIIIIKNQMDRDKERTAICQIDLEARLDGQGRSLTRENTGPGPTAKNVASRLKEAEEFFRTGFISKEEYAALRAIILKQ